LPSLGGKNNLSEEKETSALLRIEVLIIGVVDRCIFFHSEWLLAQLPVRVCTRLWTCLRRNWIDEL